MLSRPRGDASTALGFDSHVHRKRIPFEGPDRTDYLLLISLVVWLNIQAGHLQHSD